MSAGPGAGSPPEERRTMPIELLWDLNASRAVTDEQRERLRKRLAPRLDSEGMVRVVASDRRSQNQNREDENAFEHELQFLPEGETAARW